MSVDLAGAASSTSAGIQAYARGDFGAAVQAFQSAVEAGADSADVWYDLGNALYRTGQHGRAAVAWERALRRDPDLDDAQANLSIVRGASADAAIVGEEPVLSRLGARLDPDPLAAALLACWALACAALVAQRLVAGRASRAILAVSGALLVAGSALLGGATLLAERARTSPDAVVVAGTVPVRDAPEDSARAAFELHEGTRVRLAGPTGAFTRIRLPSGLTGWVETRDIEPVGAR